MSTPSRKPYELTFERRPEYIYARLVAPEMDPEIARDYQRDLAIECEATGLEKVMLWREVPSAMGAGTAFLAVDGFLHRLPGVKLAIVTPYWSDDEGLKLATRVAKRRGAAHKIFTTKEEAEKWLLCDD